MLYAARYTIEAPTRREELAHQRALAEKLLAYAQSRLPPGGRTSVQLIAAGGKEDFYEKLGFRKMPGGGCGFALRRVLHGHPAE